MQRVVERVQRENEALKKSPTGPTQDQLITLELENKKLKVSITAPLITDSIEHPLMEKENAGHLYVHL